MDSQDTNSKNHISDTELQELGISRELWEDWYSVMDNLYVVGQHLYPGKITNQENELVMEDLGITASFVNGGHIEVTVTKGEIGYLTVRYNNNIPTIVSAVYAVVQDHLGPTEFGTGEDEDLDFA